jgi:hypothetical protein
VESPKVLHFGQDLALLVNLRLEWKMVSMTTTFAYNTAVIIIAVKRFEVEPLRQQHYLYFKRKNPTKSSEKLIRCQVMQPGRESSIRGITCTVKM